MSKTYYIVAYQLLILPITEEDEAYWKHYQDSFSNLKWAKSWAKKISQYYRYKNVHLIKATPKEEIEF